MPTWNIDIKQQKKGSGYIVAGYSSGHPPDDEAYIIFISKIHTIHITRHGLSIQAGDNYSTHRFDMPESDRKAVLDFIVEEQRNKPLISNEAIKSNARNTEATNSRLEEIQELLSAQHKQISANQILLDSMLKELIKPKPKKSQTALILKHGGFA